VAKIDEDLIVYEGFIATGGVSNGDSQLNFKRVAHDAIIRDRKKRKSQGYFLLKLMSLIFIFDKKILPQKK
jgi:hypothetical protein